MCTPSLNNPLLKPPQSTWGPRGICSFTSRINLGYPAILQADQYILPPKWTKMAKLCQTHKELKKWTHLYVYHLSSVEPYGQWLKYHSSHSLTQLTSRFTKLRRLVLSITGLQLVDQDPDDQRVVNQVGASQHGAILGMPPTATEKPTLAVKPGNGPSAGGMFRAEIHGFSMRKVCEPVFSSEKCSKFPHTRPNYVGIAAWIDLTGPSFGGGKASMGWGQLGSKEHPLESWAERPHSNRWLAWHVVDNEDAVSSPFQMIPGSPGHSFPKTYESFLSHSESSSQMKNVTEKDTTSWNRGWTSACSHTLTPGRTFQRLQQRVPLSRGNGQDLSLGQPIFVLARGHYVWCRKCCAPRPRIPRVPFSPELSFFPVYLRLTASYGTAFQIFQANNIQRVRWGGYGWIW